MLAIYCCLIFISILSSGEFKNEKVATKVYGYGEHHPNDTLAFAGQGRVPKYVPIFHYKVAKTDEPLPQPYSYVRVEYINQVSKVRVHYEPSNNSLAFFVKLPFANTPFVVMAYFAGPRDPPVTETASDSTVNGLRVPGCQSCVIDYY